MRCRPILPFAVAASLLCLPWCVSARAADRLPAAEEWIPPQAVIALSVRDANALLNFALQPGMVQAVETSALYKAQAANEGLQQVRTLSASLETRLNADWKTVLHRLVGGGVTWAMGPKKGYVLIVDALDTEAPKAAHELLMRIVADKAGADGKTAAIAPTKIGDVDVWSLGPDFAYTILGRRMLIASGTNAIKAALDLRAKPGSASLAGRPGYLQACKAAGPDAAAVLYANTAILKHAPPIAKALAGDGNPLVALLAGPLTEAVRRSNWLSIAAKPKGQTVTLQVVCDGAAVATGPDRFAVPAEGDGALADLVVPRQIAAASFHRDLRGFYAAKDQLFPERTSGLIFFENMMGIFFTGRDLTEEVLGETGSKVRLVVAEQKYDPAIGTPGLRLPAFAVVLPMKNPQDFSIVMEEAWQKAIGLINFTSGQKAEPGLIIDRPVHAGVKYTVACFAPPRSKDRSAIHTRYNFRPALAMPGNFIILSSTDALAEDVMDALAAERKNPPKPLAGAHSLVEIDGGALASILAANRENLIRQSMVDKGNARDRAEIETDALLEIVKYLAGAKLTVSTEKTGSRATLEVRLALPTVKNGGK